MKRITPLEEHVGPFRVSELHIVHKPKLRPQSTSGSDQAMGEGLGMIQGASPKP